MPDRLYESAAAIPKEMLDRLYQLQLLDYLLAIARSRHGEPLLAPPPHPSTTPHLFHNEMKVETAMLCEKQSITEYLAQHCATDSERALVEAHPAWIALKNKTANRTF